MGRRKWSEDRRRRSLGFAVARMSDTKGDVSSSLSRGVVRQSGCAKSVAGSLCSMSSKCLSQYPQNRVFVAVFTRFCPSFDPSTSSFSSNATCHNGGLGEADTILPSFGRARPQGFIHPVSRSPPPIPMTPASASVLSVQAPNPVRFPTEEVYLPSTIGDSQGNPVQHGRVRSRGGLTGGLDIWGVQLLAGRSHPSSKEVAA